MAKLINCFNIPVCDEFPGGEAALASVFPEDGEYVILPGFCDVHVHFREPGFSYKETISSGCAAAARGGYTAVCAMPNLNPVPDCPENLKLETDLIKAGACIRVYPYGALTRGEKGTEAAELEQMAADVIAFSDDGRGVQSEELMREVMLRAKKLDKLAAAHTEDDALTNGGCVNFGEFSRSHGLPGIPNESEWRQIERDLRLAAETGCRYHVCHVSCRESVDIIRKAKTEGIDVTCETAPHYLLLDDSMLKDEGRFKMKPPIRAKADREALIEGLLDGTVDMIATDHAPHSAKEKAGTLKDGAFGIVGLETAFPALYTGLVKTGILSLAKLVELMSFTPRKRFGITADAGFSVWNLNAKYRVDPADFLSKGKSTPFEGCELYGSCLLTVLDGTAIYRSY